MTVHFDTLQKGGALTAASSGTESGFSGGLYRTVGKRIFDVALTIVTAPVWMTIIGAVTILLTLRGQHPFYVQRRLGQNGRVFRMIKFRTMVADAEQALSNYLAANEDARMEWAANQKLRRDPRITPFGHFLRKSSIDELPQVLNVLKGDMSLVGPRPMMPEQRALYPGIAYYSLRPGITGPWQVSDRNDCEFRDRAEHDTRYASEVSFARDLALVLRTVLVVFRGTGC